MAAVVMAFLVVALSAFFAGRFYENKLRTSSVEPPLSVFVCKTGVVYHTLSTCSYLKTEHGKLCTLCKKGKRQAL